MKTVTRADIQPGEYLNHKLVTGYEVLWVPEGCSEKVAVDFNDGTTVEMYLARSKVG
jgi:hypothetical protein